MLDQGWITPATSIYGAKTRNAAQRNMIAGGVGLGTGL